MQRVYITPGEYFLGDQPVYVDTVLGSCVAVTMYHRQTGLAAACHGVQPDCGKAAACRTRCRQPGRYINCVVPAMIRAFCAQKIRLDEIEIKLFGGAAMIGDSNGRNRNLSIGQSNLAAVRQIMKSHGLQEVAAQVGGDFGRKIIFNTATGVVLLKRMQRGVQLLIN